jgi:Integrase core domain/Fic/DOC family
MRAQGLQGRAAKRWKKTTIADPAAARADRIRRDFTADAFKLNTRWCGDITYIPTWEGWLYLATVIDIASRRVVGYAMADHLRTELAEFFLPVSMITRASRFAGDELRTENMLLGMDRSQFIERLSYHYEQFNYIHPFREGNGRRNSATSAHCNRCSTRS